VPGPPPKPAAQRRRRNKTSTAALLVAPVKPVIPVLPGDEWRTEVQAWWQEVWASPMAAEWDRSDVHGLVLIADLMQVYWSLPPEKAMAKATLAAEIRLQRTEYGLTSMARRRLQWEIERGEEAAAKTQARRSTASPTSRRRADPRLKAV
jgi:hypothetical protein